MSYENVANDKNIDDVWIYSYNNVIFYQISENFRSRIVSWLQFNRRNFQSLSNQISLHDEEKYRLCDIENMNQTSIAYEFLQEHTYDFKEAKTIWIKTHRSEWDYRQATLMLYVSADDIARCKSLFIFKSKNEIKNNTIKKKMSKYDKKVMIQWNSKTYCNAIVMIRWLRQQYKYVIERFANSFIKRFLFLDVFFDQKTAEIMMFLSLNIIFINFFR
jgi:hypothetical protein